ncbi:glycosyltransferase family protein [Streptomyces radiopugnans]|uniref:glycosyltransferase family protein n=1 Tax=Streptomyces radiopugnans TaxID=403935 RepID=UPI003F1A82CA
MAEPRTYALYWHNGRSLGHTAESAKVAHRLFNGDMSPSVAALTGAYRGLDLLPDGVDVVKLPSFSNYDMADGWHLRPRLAMGETQLHQLRAELARTFMHSYEPDTFIVNHLPRGAHDELVPTLTGRDTGHNVLTLRGVLFDPRKTEREYFALESSAWLARHFCQINIHTHPDVFRLEEHYKIPEHVTERFHYTGYLVRPIAMDPAEARRILGVPPGERLVVCAMGGGQGAGDIWRSVSRTLRRHRHLFDRALLVPGPYLEPADRCALRTAWRDDPAVVVDDYQPRLQLWMRACDLFIGAAGANMLGEVLSTGCNAVVIPRQVRESEQDLHSGRLAGLGLIRRARLPEVLAGGWDGIMAEALEAPIAPAAERYFADDGPYQRHLPAEDGGTRCAC